MSRRTLALAILALALIAACRGGDAPTPETPPPAEASQRPAGTPPPAFTIAPLPEATSRPAPAPALASPDATPPPPPGVIGDGEYVVGVDIQPGHYRATSFARLRDCYWERRGPSGERWTGGSSVGGGLTHRVSHSSIVEIAPTDVIFRSWGCGAWVPGLSPILALGQPFGEGTFLVGTEIEPGRHRAPGGVPGKLCVWWRLSGFGGNGPSLAPPSSSRFVLGMGEGEGTVVADIAPTDAGFSSHGCGVWSRSHAPAAEPGQPFGDGSFLVGAEVAPGRYRNPGVIGYRDCIWRRLGGFGGAPGDILGEGWSGSYAPLGVADDIPPSIVDIEPTDTGFYSYGCGDWTSDSTPLAMPGQPFGEGAYLVGAEVAPGRYRADSPHCLWERLGGFGGRPGDIVRSARIGNEGGLPVVVRISPGDVGFQSWNCGVWAPDSSSVPAAGEIGPGAHFAGEEIAPGRYRAPSNAYSGQCRWERWAERPEEQTRRLHPVGSGSARQGPAIVDIADSDVMFRSVLCGVWTRDPATPATVNALLDAPQLHVGGTWLVGSEIAPGRYRANPAGTCRWRRLRGFGGSDGDVIEQGEESAPFAVEIAPTDIGFGIDGVCGAWTPVP